MIKSNSLVTVALALLLFAGCDASEKSTSPSEQNQPTQATTESAGLLPDATPVPARKAVELDLRAETPLAPLSDVLKAGPITDASGLVAGQLADAALGDLSLENDQVRVVIGRPDKTAVTGYVGGNVLDVVQKKYPLDYINFMKTVSDLESTGTEFRYDEATVPPVEGNTTASIVYTGYLGEQLDDDPDTAPLRRIAGVGITTTYSLAKHQNYVQVTTRITNDSSQTVDLLPGDLIDWGGSVAFVEGFGAAGRGTDVATNAVIGSADDYSLGVVTSGTEKMHGFSTFRHSVIRHFGKGKPAMAVTPTPPSPGKSGKPVDEGDRPPQMFAPRPVNLPSGAVAPPKTETSFAAPARAVTPPRTETSFAPPAGLFAPPATETKFNRVAPSVEETTFRPASPANTRNSSNDTSPSVEKEGKGGGGGAKDDSTTPTSTPITSPIAGKAEPDRLLLQPGKSYEFTRYLVLSDADYTRITKFAYDQKQITTGTVAGAVLEQGTDAPIAGAEVRLSGGPEWNGVVQPRPFIKGITRDDGTFAINVPVGNYAISTFKTGRQAVSRTQPLNVVSGANTQVVLLQLSRESIVSIGVSAAETATSTPLPAKVTIVAKPGTQELNWTLTPDISKGVRNVYYLPSGGAHIPVSPGRYQVTISRGIEYDIVQRELTVEPGSKQELLVSLPHVVRPAGVIAMDAGVFTNKSSVSTVTPRDRVIMAACEGVPVLVTGDFNTATDLQPEIEALGLQKRLKAFKGMRLLLKKDSLSAQVFVYPLVDDTAAKVLEFHKQHAALPPDVFLADFKKQFKDVIIQIDRGLDDEVGYFKGFNFDVPSGKFTDGALPPADFDAVQVMDGNKVLTYDAYVRPFYALLTGWASQPGASAALAPTSGSNSKTPMGEETGYPRVYLYAAHDTIQTVTPADIVRAVKNQNFVVTNGPLPIFSVYDPATGRYSKMPGDVVNLSTTMTLRLKINILAAPWVDVQGFNLNVNGQPNQKIEIMPGRKPLRYPIHQRDDADTKLLYIQKDSVVDFFTFSSRRSLAPVVPRLLPDLGGEVFPIAWTGPIYVDRDGDGQIVIPPK